MAQIIHQIVMMTYTTIFHQLCRSNIPENYLQCNQQKLLKIGEQFFDRLLKIVVNNTIQSISSATQTNFIDTT